MCGGQGLSPDGPGNAYLRPDHNCSLRLSVPPHRTAPRPPTPGAVQEPNSPTGHLDRLRDEPMRHNPAFPGTSGKWPFPLSC